MQGTLNQCHSLKHWVNFRIVLVNICELYVSNKRWNLFLPSFVLHSSVCSFSGPGNFCLIHVSLVPVLNVVGEQVTIMLFCGQLYYVEVD